ncbi:POK11 protein, partial [Rhabdornis inornatus]|nr:POK11 protein [Rhabdornis inornatus]
GFEISKDKIQFSSPWTYLGLRIQDQTVVPQQLVIRDDPKTLRDLHQLWGSINWVRPLLGITTEDLAPLFNLLRGSEDLDSPRELTAEARQLIQKVQEALTSRQAHRFEPTLTFQLAILEWVFPHHQPTKTISMPQELTADLIKKARAHLCSLAGCEFTCIILPLATIGDLEHLLQSNESLQFALDSYPGQISIHLPGHKLFKSVFNLVPKFIQSKSPLKALTIFTDGSGASHKSVMMWKDPQTQKWESDVQVVEGSPRIAEVAAVVRTFERFQESINVVTDSAYVAGVTMRAEHALLKEVSSPNLYKLLSKLIYVISHRKQPYHIMHVRSHTDLPGPTAEGTRRADALAMPIEISNIPDIFAQAKLLQNCHCCKIAIVATCPNCQSYQLPSLESGVNPRG